MEYCSHGTIEEAAKQGLSEVVIRRYTKFILTAVDFLHEHNVVHRDIKGYQPVPLDCRVFSFNWTIFPVLLELLEIVAAGPAGCSPYAKEMGGRGDTSPPP